MQIRFESGEGGFYIREVVVDVERETDAIAAGGDENALGGEIGSDSSRVGGTENDERAGGVVIVGFGGDAEGTDALDEGLREMGDLGGDIGETNFRDEFETFAHGIDAGHGRRSAIEAAGGGRRVESLGVEGKDVALGHPTGNGGLEGFSQRSLDI